MRNVDVILGPAVLRVGGGPSWWVTTAISVSTLVVGGLVGFIFKRRLQASSEEHEAQQRALSESHERRMEAFRLEIDEIKSLMTRIQMADRELRNAVTANSEFRAARADGTGTVGELESLEVAAKDSLERVDDALIHLHEPSITTAPSFDETWQRYTNSIYALVAAIYEANEAEQHSEGPQIAAYIEAKLAVQKMMKNAVARFRRGASTFPEASDEVRPTD